MLLKRRFPVLPWLFFGLQLSVSLLWLWWLPLLGDAAQAPTGSVTSVRVMFLYAGWLPTLAIAAWQSRHQRWRSLLLSDLLCALGLSAVALTLYLPLFFTMGIWFLPFAVMPRGCLARLLLSFWPNKKPPAQRGRNG